MSRDLDIYTETMARVYADQGHWSKVAQIYKHLLTREPDRQDFVAALAQAETKMKEISKKTPEKLVPLFQEWIDLIFEHQKLLKLKKLKDRW